ncbi:hypothetical protein LSH36_565g02043 [Paralvinella palmiformis]|uniref:Uncharacterized protein n=1 Tax=Paralvinella palmiformis TaxID=53620 RepID=A0AAD9MVC9_9ANNE|nr:hypothetical protein LSH36_565g02043 [Paralvinella palmiformis]
MDQSNMTTGPEVLRESVADIALKSYTLYFLVTATILGLLLLAALRKATKICCWQCMYGSKYIRSEKEDPRVPATLFRMPSVLTTLQDHYDKGRSLRSTTKSEATSRSYVSAQDIEYAVGDDNTRVHHYLDAESEREGDSLDRADVTNEVNGVTSAILDEDSADGGNAEGEEPGTSVGDPDTEVVGVGNQRDQREERQNESDDDGSDPETTERQIENSEREYVNKSPTNEDDGEITTEHEERDKHNVRTSTDVLRDTDQSKQTDQDDEYNDADDTPTENNPSSYVSEIVIEEETIPREDPDIELQDMGEPVDSFTVGRHSSVSEESLASTINDDVPLVSPTPPAGESVRRGRYKKNSGQKFTSGYSARSTSAKLSKRIGKQT